MEKTAKSQNQALCVFLFIDESLNAHEFFHAI